MKTAGLVLAGFSLGVDFAALVLESLPIFGLALVILFVAVALMIGGEDR